MEAVRKRRKICVSNMWKRLSQYVNIAVCQSIIIILKVKK